MSQRKQHSRRRFLGAAAASTGLWATAGCQSRQAVEDDSGRRRLRAAFSNAGLQSTWCKLGKDTAELWGNLLGVDVVWYDGEFDPQTQRNKIDLIVDDDLDFCCFQAVQIDSLAEPVRQLQKRGVPVIAMDTLLVKPEQMRDVGVWLQVMPDHVHMAELSTQYLMQKIGGRGNVIHIGGLSAHSGAQGRKRGFENVVAKYPAVKVVGGGVRWCDWKKQKARDTFETLLEQSEEPIVGAFFHSDDMALACIPALSGSNREQMVITAIDGQKEGLEAVRRGELAATTVNPVCLIHRTALEIGQFIIRNQEKVEGVPRQIITPGPLVTLENGNLEAQLYLADPRHCIA